LSAADLAFHTADMTYKAEPGMFHVMIGPDSERLSTEEITLVK
jgi:hypothetical protein